MCDSSRQPRKRDAHIGSEPVLPRDGDVDRYAGGPLRDTYRIRGQLHRKIRRGGEDRTPPVPPAPPHAAVNIKIAARAICGPLPA